MCSTSADQFGARLWCGTGWTGQPNVIVHDDGTIEIREGAYDGRVPLPERPDRAAGPTPIW